MTIPYLDRLWGDAEQHGHFLHGQHTCLTQPIIARHQTVPFLDTSDDPHRKRLPFSRAQATLVQYGYDLRMGVVIEEPIDFLHHGGVGCSLLPRIERSGYRQGLGGPALETNV